MMTGSTSDSAIEPVPTDQPDDDQLLVRSKLLNPYRKDDDYGPWLATVRRQAMAKLTQQLDIDLAVFAAFGAELLTSSPFRARALRRLRGPLPRSSDYDISAPYGRMSLASGGAWASC